MKVHGANIKIQGSGTATCLNDAISGHARVMLLASGLPQSFWAFAILYAVWLHNHALTKQTGLRSHDEQETRPEARMKIWVRGLGVREQRCMGRAE
jgi:hypothetical protein